MDYLKQIDTVFFYFKEKSQVGGYFDYQDVWEHVQNIKAGITDQAKLNTILARLKEDGFISGGDRLNSMSTPTYSISFKGLLFDGYENERTLAIQKNTLLEQQVTRTSEISELNAKLAVRSYRLTLILAIGTSIAAIYYLMEIAKYLGWICPNHQ